MLYRGRVDPPGSYKPPQNPCDPSQTHPKPFNDPPYNQFNPSGYLITHYCSQKTQIAIETPNMRKYSQNAQKRKNTKSAKTEM